MWIFETIGRWALKLIEATTRGPKFVCQGCARWEQCGQPPSETCLFRIEQIYAYRPQRPGLRIDL